MKYKSNHRFSSTENNCLGEGKFRIYLLSFVATSLLLVGCHSDEEYVWPSSSDSDADIDSDSDDENAPDTDADTEMECNSDDEPTWSSPINQIMQQRCTSCHSKCSSYQGIINWANNGKLLDYTYRNHYWGNSQNAEKTARWVQIGAPEYDCDVQYENLVLSPSNDEK